MIIIVEGIDRVGKTTLCNKLKKEFDLPIYNHVCNGRREYSKINNFTETDKLLQMIELCRITNASVIFDRFYFTDFVYGIIERNYDIDFAVYNFRKLDEYISQINDVFLIYVLPTDVKQSSEEHGKPLAKYDEGFFKLFQESKIKNKWRCTYNTMDEVISFIKAKEVIKHEQIEWV